MNNIPNWYEFLLLALAAFRIFHLVSEDTILDRPRAWLLRLGDWEEGKALPRDYRAKWGAWIVCRWCAGFHISVAWWLAWMIEPHWTTVAAVPWALSAALAFIAGLLED